MLWLLGLTKQYYNHEQVYIHEQTLIDYLTWRLWRAEGEEVGGVSANPSMPRTPEINFDWWMCTPDMVADGLTRGMK